MAMMVVQLAMFKHGESGDVTRNYCVDRHDDGGVGIICILVEKKLIKEKMVLLGFGKCNGDCVWRRERHGNSSIDRCSDSVKVGELLSIVKWW